MKENSPNQPIDPEIEARITALVLGELSPTQRAELDRLIDQRPELQSLKEQIESAHKVLSGISSDEFPVDGDWKLSSDKRAAVLSVIDVEKDESQARSIVMLPKPVAAPFRIDSSWNLTRVAAVLVIAVSTGLLGMASLYFIASPEAFQTASNSVPSFRQSRSIVIENFAGRGDNEFFKGAFDDDGVVESHSYFDKRTRGVARDFDASAEDFVDRFGSTPHFDSGADGVMSAPQAAPAPVETSGPISGAFGGGGMGSGQEESVLNGSGPMSESLNALYSQVPVPADQPVASMAPSADSPVPSEPQAQVPDSTWVDPQVPEVSSGGIGYTVREKLTPPMPGIASNVEGYALQVPEVAGESKVSTGQVPAFSGKQEAYTVEVPSAQVHVDSLRVDNGPVQVPETSGKEEVYSVNVPYSQDPSRVQDMKESADLEMDAGKSLSDLSDTPVSPAKPSSPKFVDAQRGATEAAGKKSIALGGQTSEALGREMVESDEEVGLSRSAAVYNGRWAVQQGQGKVVEGEPALGWLEKGNKDWSRGESSDASDVIVMQDGFGNRYYENDRLSEEITKSIDGKEQVEFEANLWGLDLNDDSSSRRSLQRLDLKNSLRMSKSGPAQAPLSLGEKLAVDEPFSTFSLHVSDVSFKLAQSSLSSGQWPEAAKIRIEEFVNAFDYGDPVPSESEKVACQIEQSAHPFLQQRNVMRVAMRTAATGRATSTPLRLTLLLDNSGSMERADRQETVRKAFRLLAGQLTANDKITLISFARQPRLLADNVVGDQAIQLVSLIDQLPSEGGTNIEASLQLALEKAIEQKTDDAQNRIVLLTDGAVNLGDADPESLSRMVTAIRDSGIAFDAAGINADGLNDEVLEALTRKGDGRYYLLDSVEAADDRFAKQIAGALRPSAKNVKVQVEFNPARVGRYKLLGFEKHLLKQEDFRNDKVDAAELAAAEAGVAVYQFEAKPDGEGDVGSVSVRFQDLSTGEMIEKRWPIPYEAKAPQIDQASASLRIATAAATLAAKLRGEPSAESVDYKMLAGLVSELPQSVRMAKQVEQLQLMIQQSEQISGQ
jgi:Mg-chelatase subunit ChlD